MDSQPDCAFATCAIIIKTKVNNNLFITWDLIIISLYITAMSRKKLHTSKSCFCKKVWGSTHRGGSHISTQSITATHLYKFNIECMCKYTIFFIHTKKRSPSSELLIKNWRRPTFPQTSAVSSAMRGLTSLFGMGRGEHPLHSHQK